MRVITKRRSYSIRDETLVYFDNREEFMKYGFDKIKEYIDEIYEDEHIFRNIINCKGEIIKYNNIMLSLNTYLHDVSYSGQRFEYDFDTYNYQFRIYIEEIPNYGIRVSIYCINMAETNLTI